MRMHRLLYPRSINSRVPTVSISFLPLPRQAWLHAPVSRSPCDPTSRGGLSSPFISPHVCFGGHLNEKVELRILRCGESCAVGIASFSGRQSQPGAEDVSAAGGPPIGPQAPSPLVRQGMRPRKRHSNGCERAKGRARAHGTSNPTSHRRPPSAREARSGRQTHSPLDARALQSNNSRATLGGAALSWRDAGPHRSSLMAPTPEDVAQEAQPGPTAGLAMCRANRRWIAENRRNLGADLAKAGGRPYSREQR